MNPPTTSESSAGDSSFESSAGPSRKRCRSHDATVTSFIPALGALVPSRADLILPRKRFRDSISPEASVEEYIDAYVLADIKADATTIVVAVDIDVEAGVDTGIDRKVDVGVDIKDEVEGEVESSARGTMKVGVDVVAEIDVPDGMLMPDVVERLEQALAAYEANCAAELAVESQSQNGDDDDNENVGGNGNENGEGNGDENGRGNGNRNRGGNGNGNLNRKWQGHYRSDCPKLKNQNRGNKTGNKTNKARGKAYVLEGGEANPDSNVVT
nr:hypothetical protein [Tanacetum cinerariifolium]GFA85151.1 hypothetical protein [Tanacetum cinerariifolium]